MLANAPQEAAETVRAAVATLLSQLAKQPLHGPRIVLLLNRLLPPGLVSAIEVSLSFVTSSCAEPCVTDARATMEHEHGMTMAQELASLAASEDVPSLAEMWKLISQDGPGETAVAALGHASETPERLWSMSMATTMVEDVASLAAQGAVHIMLRCGGWSYRMGPGRQQ